MSYQIDFNLVPNVQGPLDKRTVGETLPDTPYTGQLFFATDSNQLYVWKATGSDPPAWVEVVDSSSLATSLQNFNNSISSVSTSLNLLATSIGTASAPNSILWRLGRLEHWMTTHFHTVHGPQTEGGIIDTQDPYIP